MTTKIVTKTIITFQGVEISPEAATEMLTDKSIPLDERWELYEQMVKHHVITSDEGYGDGFIETLTPGGTLYDDYYMDRHVSMTYPDMLERAEDTNKAHNVEEWKEKVLAAGDASFTNDW